MTDISKYRKGFEAMTEKLAESRDDDRSIPEKFVDGLAHAPLTFWEEMTRGADEDRGRRDARDGNGFKP